MGKGDRLRILLSLLLTVAVAFGQGAVQRNPVTTNLATYSNPTHGQVVTLHVAGGVVSHTNRTFAGGAGNPAGNDREVQINDQGTAFSGSSIKIPAGGTNLVIPGRADVSEALATNRFMLGSASNTIWLSPNVTKAEITNRAMNPIPGTRLGLTAGQYHLGPVTTKFRGNIHLDEGVTLSYGTNDTSGSQASAGLFDDTDMAVTNILTGAGRIICSNKWQPVVKITRATSKMYIEALDLIRADTNLTGQAVIFKSDGELFFDIKRDIENAVYDAYWDDTGSGLTVGRAGRMYVGDTAIEYTSGTAARPHFFDIGVIEKRVMVHNRATLMQIPDNVHVRAGVIHCHSNSVVLFNGDGVYPASIEASLWTQDADSNTGILSVAAPTAWVRIRGHFQTFNLANIPPIYVDGVDFTMDNVSVSTTTSVAIQGTAGRTLRIVGGFARPSGGLVDQGLEVVGYNKPQYVTNVSDNVSLTEDATHVEVRKLASSGSKSVILTNVNRYIRGDTVWIKDVNGTAGNSSSNIIVKSANGTIDGVAGSTGKTISSDYGALFLWNDGTNWWTHLSPDMVIPNSAAPTTDTFGEVAADNNAWAASRGAVQFFDGTANTYLLGALVSDTPSNGQVPKWNTGGTITWEDDNNSGLGAGDSALVNSTAISDSFSLTNITASSTAAGITWTVAAGTDPDPDKVSLAIAAATSTTAGTVSAAQQTFGGDKVFAGKVTNQSTLTFEVTGPDPTIHGANSTLTVSNADVVLLNSFQVTGDAGVSGSLQVSSDATIDGNLTVNGSATGTLKLSDTDGDKWIRIAAPGTVNTNVEFIAPQQPEDGFLFSTLSQGTNSTLSYVALTSVINDTAFASSWNGVTTVGGSKNAIYDWGHIFDTDDDGKVNVLDQTAGIANTDANGVLQSALSTTGSGNVMRTRTGVYREVSISAGAITPATTNGAALGTNTVGSDGLTIDVLDFDDTTAEYGWFVWWPPDTWDMGTVKAKFQWTTTSGTGGVVWGLAGGAVADDGTLNGTVLGTAQTVADTRLADHDMHVTSATGAITVAGTPTLAKPVFWRVHRLPTDGSDTKTGDARLIGIKIQYLESTTEASAW